MTEKLDRTQIQHDKAKAEKERLELQSLKLSRDLEKVQYELREARDLRGIEDKRSRDNLEHERTNRELEDLHARSISCNIFKI